MSILTRLFAKHSDPREKLRPLWHALVARSRAPVWYADLGVADTVPGRFDMITVMTALALLRIEQDADLAREAALLTELFVEDMDGQLRESGIGDVVVGKHVGRLMGVLGGRLGAYREALAEPGDAALTEAVVRNVSLTEGADAAALAAAVRSAHADFAACPTADFVAGRIAP